MLAVLLFTLLILSPTSNGAEVLQVIDGDTITIVNIDTHRLDRVRLIGVNAPEMKPSPYCGAVESTAYLNSLLKGQVVTLVPGALERDRYGRLLAYVWRTDYNEGMQVMVNWEVIRNGHASTMIIPPNDRYKDLFKTAYSEARQERRGMHERCRV